MTYPSKYVAGKNIYTKNVFILLDQSIIFELNQTMTWEYHRFNNFVRQIIPQAILRKKYVNYMTISRHILV